jgi:hypothetical protein
MAEAADFTVCDLIVKVRRAYGLEQVEASTSRTEASFLLDHLP